MKPSIETGKELKSEISIQEKSLTRIEEKLIQLQELENNPTKDWTNAINLIPTENQQEGIMRDIKRIADTSGYQFKNIGFDDNVDKELKTGRIAIRVSVTGPYDKLFYFLSLLEQNPRYVGIENLKLSSKTTDTGRIANMSLSLYALYQFKQ